MANHRWLWFIYKYIPSISCHGRWLMSKLLWFWDTTTIYMPYGALFRSICKCPISLLNDLWLTTTSEQQTDAFYGRNCIIWMLVHTYSHGPNETSQNSDQNKPLILAIYSSSDREVSTGYLVSKTLTVSIDYSSLEEASSRVTFYQISLNSIWTW